MINMFEVNETNKMIDPGKPGCAYHHHGYQPVGLYRPQIWSQLNQNVYEKITEHAKNLVSTGEEIEREFGIPIVNKRISVTPIALIGGAACKTPEDFVTLAKTLDRAAKEVGVNFIGGYSALVSKGMTSSR